MEKKKFNEFFENLENIVERKEVSEMTAFEQVVWRVFSLCHKLTGKVALTIVTRTQYLTVTLWSDVFGSGSMSFAFEEDHGEVELGIKCQALAAAVEAVLNHKSDE